MLFPFGYHNAVVIVFLAVELPEDYRGRWETFVDQTLSETNRKNTIDLVYPHTLFTAAVFIHTQTFRL